MKTTVSLFRVDDSIQQEQINHKNIGLGFS